LALHRSSLVSGGRGVFDKLYLHIEPILELGDTAEGVALRERISKVEKLADLRRGEDFNSRPHAPAPRTRAQDAVPYSRDI
jgi:hypothetical protein